VTQVVCALGVYLHHRHQLVIHTDNVGQLLEERTAALLDAKKELARQNEILEVELAEQARDLDRKNKDLQLKNEVIDRQRRLELAAQTAGQVAHDIQNPVAPLHGIESLEVRTLNGSGRDERLGSVEQLPDSTEPALALAPRPRGLFPVRLSELISEVRDGSGATPRRRSGRDATRGRRPAARASPTSSERLVKSRPAGSIPSDRHRGRPQQRRCHPLPESRSTRSWR
jgi:hypothetical protein